MSNLTETDAACQTNGLEMGKVIGGEVSHSVT